MTDKDIDDFSKRVAELKTKKAVLSILKDIVEPMYLNETSDVPDSIDPVSNTFHVKEDWSKYIKPYIGQPLSQKESEALQNYKEKPPTTVNRTEIWYNSTDDFGMSKTTVIKKMKDSGQFSFTAFQKQETPNSDEEKNIENQETGIGNNSNGITSPTNTSDTFEKGETEEKDDITVTKSILFKDDIKGASILINFLKKIDL
jgi:hypothetical protein